MINALFKRIGLEVFLADHYLRIPYSSAGEAQQFVNLANWDVVERLFQTPGLDSLAARNDQAAPPKVPSDFASARQFFEQGYTLGIRHAHLHDPKLADLAVSFQAVFNAPVDVHLYCTPAGCSGFGWHYDAEEVFVLQAQGEKTWQLRKNTVHPWPLIEAIPQNQQYEREIMPVMTCTLAAGDVLYIPNGYWHSTKAGKESISLSVGLRATAIDLLDFLRGRFARAIEWRQRLPLHDAAGRPLLDELLRSVAEDLQRHFVEADSVAAFRSRFGARESPKSDH